MRWCIGVMLCGFLTGLAGSAWAADGGTSRTAPLIRGALWWLTDSYASWPKEKIEQAIQAQKDVGFDILWILNTPNLLTVAERGETDFLETVYTIADAKGMRIIADLPAGGWYGKTPAEEILARNTKHIASYHERYGEHASFWGWYLNYEINPVAPDDTEQTAFWRELWRSIVGMCHGAAPESVVTISPFFLLDDGTHRGFRYQTPEEYAGWWGATMEATGIDILMLQDSGEHLSFFTLEQREPFFAAVAKACHDAGAEFWVNVETGEAHVADWAEYLALTKEKKVPWRFTPMDWLAKKLELAARHGDGIINWGYFPFMDPMAVSIDFAGGGPVTGPSPAEAYQQYKAYFHRVREAAAMAELRANTAEIKRIHGEIAGDLARMMPVKMRVLPQLARVGEAVSVEMEVLSETAPSRELTLLEDYFASPDIEERAMELTWEAAGERHGLTVFRTRHTLAPLSTGNHLLRWRSDVGGDVPEYRRIFAVIDDTFAVCLLESTSHRPPHPQDDFHELRLPFDYWEQNSLVLPNIVDNPSPAAWAGISRAYRQYGDEPTPMLFSDYYQREPDKEGRFAKYSEALQRAVLSAYRETWPLLGFDGPMRCFAAYSQGNRAIASARAEGYATISALCAGQNWQDGSFGINHSGMPDRPFFISREDFRKAGDGGPDGLVGIPQCQRNTFLTHDYNCTYVLEPAWNEFMNHGGGRKVLDDIHLSRQYDFFDAMLQNKQSHGTPYFFSMGIEFNGVSPEIAPSNRLMMEYAVKKAGEAPLVFSTGPAVTDFFRRHYTETPESVCYQPDFFGGLTHGGKPASYPDTLEFEGPPCKSLFQRPSLLPRYHYDYGPAWDYPDWGNEQLPRNERGYLTPDTYDRFEATPRIVDTRQFEVTRADADEGANRRITVRVNAKAAQTNMALALWDIPREWRAGEGWWSVEGDARLVPVRAPFTGNLNGILIANLAEGENVYTLSIATPARTLGTTTVLVGDAIEGRVFPRDGQVTAYLWPTGDAPTTLVVDLPEGKTAQAYVAPEGEAQPCGPDAARFELAPGGWMRLVGLTAEEVTEYCTVAP